MRFKKKKSIMVISKLYAGQSICSPNVSPKFGLTNYNTHGIPAISLQILFNFFFYVLAQVVECSES